MVLDAQGDVYLTGTTTSLDFPMVGNSILATFPTISTSGVIANTTGLTQARQDPSFDTYISMDVAYIENWSLMLDLKIQHQAPVLDISNVHRDIRIERRILSRLRQTSRVGDYTGSGDRGKGGQDGIADHGKIEGSGGPGKVHVALRIEHHRQRYIGCGSADIPLAMVLD